MLNARARGPDGLTAWERVKGRAFNQLVLGFAECVLYKLPTKGPRSKPDGNMGTRWLEGVFLGFNRSSNTYTIATEDGVESCRSLYTVNLSRTDGWRKGFCSSSPRHGC